MRTAYVGEKDFQLVFLACYYVTFTYAVVGTHKDSVRHRGISMVNMDTFPQYLRTERACSSVKPN